MECSWTAWPWRWRHCSPSVHQELLTQQLSAIPGDMILQHHHCENLKSCIWISALISCHIFNVSHTCCCRPLPFFEQCRGSSGIWFIAEILCASKPLPHCMICLVHALLFLRCRAHLLIQQHYTLNLCPVCCCACLIFHIKNWKISSEGKSYPIHMHFVTQFENLTHSNKECILL
jgi:hypothetical protein